MKRNMRHAFNALKKIGAPVFSVYSNGSPVENGGFKLSAEDNNDECWADYYGEFSGGYPYVNEKVNVVMDKYDLFFEWENPGCLVAVEN